MIAQIKLPREWRAHAGTGPQNAKASEVIDLQGFAKRGGRRSQRTLIVVRIVKNASHWLS